MNRVRLLFVITLLIYPTFSLADQNARQFPADQIQVLIGLAEQGSASAQYQLGEFYRAGDGVPQAYLQAVQWYRRAAEQGHVRAQNRLAHLYRIGRGLPQDYRQSVQWYRLAAEQGDANSQLYLSIHYYLGKGVPRDLISAYYWANLAATEEARAERILGTIADQMSPAQLSRARQMTVEAPESNWVTHVNN